MTDTPTPPTTTDLHQAAFDDHEDINSVHRESDDSWRHGSYITQVFHRVSDDTFWMASYRRSGDGETNELREGLAEITRVYATVVTSTVYVETPVAPSPDAADAARWRALISSQRIRVLGSAGLHGVAPIECAHIGLELWARHPHSDQDARDRELFLKYVDACATLAAQ